MNGLRATRFGRGVMVAAAVVVGAGAIAASSAAVNAADGGRVAWVTLEDVHGERVGWALFTERRTGAVQVVVRGHDLTPGAHGIHVHNVGSCASVTGSFSGAGSHHNPLGALHGSHAGDLPNLMVDARGRGRLNTTVDRFRLKGIEKSIFDADGSALVIHAAPDDYVTDPTGNSGPRVACGIITSG